MPVAQIENGVYTDTYDFYPEMGFGTERAAVCSGVAKQLHYGNDIQDVMEYFPEYASEIEETKEALESEDQYNPQDDGFQDLFYETMLGIVEQDLE